MTVNTTHICLRVFQKKREKLFLLQSTLLLLRMSSVKNSFLSSVFSFPTPAPTTDERESKSKKIFKEKRRSNQKISRVVAPRPKKDTVIRGGEKTEKIHISARCEHFRHKTTHVLLFAKLCLHCKALLSPARELSRRNPPRRPEGEYYFVAISVDFRKTYIRAQNFFGFSLSFCIIFSPPMMELLFVICRVCLSLAFLQKRERANEKEARLGETNFSLSFSAL